MPLRDPVTLYRAFEQHVDGCGVCQGNFFCEVGLDLYTSWDKAEEEMMEMTENAARVAAEDKKKAPTQPELDERCASQRR